jgi:hypothetical protein
MYKALSVSKEAINKKVKKGQPSGWQGKGPAGKYSSSGGKNV